MSLYYRPISDVFPNHKKLVNNFNIELEKVYKFAKSNMISFRDVPAYINELSKHYKYASKALKSEIHDLPDFVIHIAENMNKKNKLIKLSQEETEEDFSEMGDEAKQPGEDSWTRSWWAAGLSFIPGVGAVISLINLYKYSGAACMNSGVLSWPCCEAALNVLVILLDIATIIGLAAGGVGAVPGFAGATLVKSISPFLRIIIGTAKLSSKTLVLLKNAGKGLIWIFDKGLRLCRALKGNKTLWEIIKTRAPGLVKFLKRIEDFFEYIKVALQKRINSSEITLGWIKPTSKIRHWSNKIRFITPVKWIRTMNLSSIIITDILAWWMSDGEGIVDSYDQKPETSETPTPDATDVSVLVEKVCSSLRQRLESKNFKPEEIENAINKFRVTITRVLTNEDPQSSAASMSGYGKRTFNDMDAGIPKGNLKLGF